MKQTFWGALLRPKVWIAKLLLLCGIVAFFSLGFLDYLEPIKAFLDSDTLSFNIGDARFSVYLLTKAILTIIILFWVADIFAEFGKTRITHIKGMDQSNKLLIIKAIQIVVYIVVFLIGLDVLGIDLTTLAVFSGAVGIGLGFGLQKITSNFISGIILLFEKSIKQNDLIELSDNIYGFIRHTGARYTLVETLDGKEMIIPNEDFITQRVTNWTYSTNKGRIECTIGVSYECDVEKAMALILEAAKEQPNCVKSPEPECFLREFADSSINFLVFFWVKDVRDDRHRTKSEVMLAIWKKFKEHGITIPYPQRDVHIKNHEK